MPPPNLAGCDASGDHVVDLDREIELFKLRAGARLQGAMASPAAAAHASIATPPANSQPEATPAAAAPQPRRPAEPVAPTPLPTPSPRHAADAAACRAPDTLGLSRMMQKCGWLESEMGAYEASQYQGQHPKPNPPCADSEGRGLVTTTKPAASAPKPRKAAAALPLSLGSTGGANQGRSSFGACNERLVEMVGRLLGHLKHAQAELLEQAHLRQHADAQLAECREQLHAHRESSEAEAAAVRLMVTELRAAHEAALGDTRARLNSLEQSRASVRHRRPLAPLPTLVHTGRTVTPTWLAHAPFWCGDRRPTLALSWATCSSRRRPMPPRRRLPQRQTSSWPMPALCCGTSKQREPREQRPRPLR